MTRSGSWSPGWAAGDVMGEKAILGHFLRIASPVALTRLDLIPFTDGDVRRLCDDMPKSKTELERAAAVHDR